MSAFGEQIYRHATYSTVKAWRERHGRYRLVGSTCTACNARFFPRRALCTQCSGREMRPYECSPAGSVIVSWSQLGMLRLLGYADLPSRTVAIVRLDDGIFIEAEIVGLTGQQTLPKGTRVDLVFRRLKQESNGNNCYGYKFTPSLSQPVSLPEPQADLLEA